MKISAGRFRGLLFGRKNLPTGSVGRAIRSLTKAEKGSLLSPIGRQPRSFAHQSHCIEVKRLTTVYDCRGDVGSQPRKPQQGVYVGWRHVHLASKIVDRQRGILIEALLYVVRASDDPEKARVGCHLLFGVLQNHFHFSADASETDGNR